MVGWLVWIEEFWPNTEIFLSLWLVVIMCWRRRRRKRKREENLLMACFSFVCRLIYIYIYIYIEKHYHYHQHCEMIQRVNCKTRFTWAIPRVFSHSLAGTCRSVLPSRSSFSFELNLWLHSWLTPSPFCSLSPLSCGGSFQSRMVVFFMICFSTISLTTTIKEQHSYNSWRENKWTVYHI